MNKNTNNGAGLRGQVAGQTSLCTVGKTGSGLTYRGYDISILAEKAKFEEVAYLLLHGELPNQEQLNNFLSKIISLRNLPQELKDTLENIPASAHPMDVLRTGCSMLGNLEPETSLINNLTQPFVYLLRYHQSSVTGIVFPIKESEFQPL